MYKIRLICLPYAGGSSASYSSWSKLLPDGVKLERPELSGRGKRFYEPLYSTLEEAVDDIFSSIRYYLNDLPYIIFGHSMGSIIAYELINKINTAGISMPLHIIFSGCNAPHVNRKEEHFHCLSDDEFEKVVLKYGGAPKEIFENKTFASYFVPILRSDFKIFETYEYNIKMRKLNSPISIFYGEQDDFVDKKKVDEWSDYTTKGFNKIAFNGSHFFISDNRNSVLASVNKIISSFL